MACLYYIYYTISLIKTWLVLSADAYTHTMFFFFFFFWYYFTFILKVLNRETGKLVGSQEGQKEEDIKRSSLKLKHSTPRTLTKEERKAQKEAIAKVIADLGSNKKKKTQQDIEADRKKREIEQENQRKRIEEEIKRIREKERQDSLTRPRGASPKWAQFYHADKNGKFKCIDSGEEIPIGHVNDDYCDCKDGTDEPGTSACTNGR